ncbi:nucleotidyltransferase domain-containing protein [Streptomyces sp. NPDC002463]|uniref:nucleotidyltransferase domain-containing protein n=1 Tax=Streptomyces sp. NPDC002463 TaxID=3364645 RepID=UPI0036C3B777
MEQPHPIPLGATIAFSGPDNVGKTKQIGILARRLGPQAQHGGPLDDFDPRWARIKNDGTGVWWFETGPIEEVADVLASSYITRAKQKVTAQVRLLDRGIPMLEASLAATVGVREHLDVDHAADRVRELLSPFQNDLAVFEAAEEGVLLIHDPDPVIGAQRSLSHEKSVTPTYVDYQGHLHAHINRLVDEGRFRVKIAVGDRPVVAVQDAIRRSLHRVHPVLPARALPGVQVIALGGLSESGKSTAGEYLRLRHGFGRLKIGHLLADSALHAGIDDPYELAPVVQAELIVDGLDCYCAAHHFLDRVSIESLHDSESTAELRRMLGDQLRVLYMDAAQHIRHQRGTSGPTDVIERDKVKEERGAARIADPADDTVNNDGTRLALERRLDRIALSQRWPLRHPVTAPVDSLGLPVRLEAYPSSLLDRVAQEPGLIDLLVVTGSGARGKYQHGWSDLDVFVVAEHRNLPAFRKILAGLEEDLGGVKLGLTVLSQDECRTGAVTSRLLHVLALIGSGSLTPLWCSPDLDLPAPDVTHDVDASVEAGVQAAMEIRRQILRGAPDLRSLFKVTALLAKIMLRFEGAECPSDDDALALFLQREPGDQGEVRRGARTQPAKAEALAHMILRHWLSTFSSPPADA